MLGAQDEYKELHGVVVTSRDVLPADPLRRVGSNYNTKLRTRKIW